MNNVKKNNKGFSLVELIVVVLIMAIIAVSLAPQVMKWVDRSRQANDAANYDALYAAAQLSAISAPAGSGKVLTITMTDDDTKVTMTTGTDAGEIAAFEDVMDVNLPGWEDIVITSTENASKSYTITISNTQVEKDDEPGEISAS